jgi:hypothetical protein
MNGVGGRMFPCLTFWKKKKHQIWNKIGTCQILMHNIKIIFKNMYSILATLGHCLPDGVPWNPGVPRSENKGSTRKIHYSIYIYIFIYIYIGMSALCVGRFLPPEKSLVLIFVRGWVDPVAIVRLEGLSKLKDSTSSGTRTGDLPACGIVPQPTKLPRAPIYI